MLLHSTFFFYTSLIDLDFDSRSQGCKKAEPSAPIVSKTFQSIWTEFAIQDLLVWQTSFQSDLVHWIFKGENLIMWFEKKKHHHHQQQNKTKTTTTATNKPLTFDLVREPGGPTVHPSPPPPPLSFLQEPSTMVPKCTLGCPEHNLTCPPDNH